MRLRKDGVTHDLLKKEYVSLLGNAEEINKRLLNSLNFVPMTRDIVTPTTQVPPVFLQVV
jgi:hypothetical protein